MPDSFMLRDLTSAEMTSESIGLKVEVKGGDRTLWAPIVRKEDTLPEHDETFAIGFWDGGVWHYCVVEIEDDDAPEITSVDISSKPVDGYAYCAGDSIDFTVNLDSEVDVEGTPLLSLYIGDGDDSTWRGASYLRGSGSRNLVFRYRVQTVDRDNDGISVSAAAMDVVFSEQVMATGDLQLELDVGGIARQATLLPVPEGTFSNPLVFQYMVQEGDMDSDGIGIGANLLKLNGGGIHDSAGNAADVSHGAVPAEPGQKVDTSP